MNKYNKKTINKDEQTNKPFDKLYRTLLQDDVIDETEYKSLCNIFTKYVDEKN